MPRFRHNARPALAFLRRKASAFVTRALASQTDEEVADLVLRMADAVLTFDAIPGAGTGLELLSDALLVQLRPRVIASVKAARARQGVAS